VNQERRGLRLSFGAAAEVASESSPSSAVAEVASESSPSSAVAAHVTELSLYGCYLDIPAPFEAKARVLVKIFHSDEYFEAKATVVYVQADIGHGFGISRRKAEFSVNLAEMDSRADE